MDPNIKAEWVAALRSGDYKQGRGQLRKKVGNQFGSGMRHCCLGVLCEITNTPIAKGQQMLIYGTAEELGLERTADCYSASLALASMNDSDRKTFPEIADWIEENL